GSSSQGLIVFDGKRFERYRWTDRDAQAVTVLLEDRGRLLIGTFAGGLLEFDGGRFREIKISNASGSGRSQINGPTDPVTLATARGTDPQISAASGSERSPIDGSVDQVTAATARGADPRRTESEQEGQRRLAGITRLIADGARLFVGTFADGLWVNDLD